MRAWLTRVELKLPTTRTLIYPFCGQRVVFGFVGRKWSDAGARIGANYKNGVLDRSENKSELGNGGGDGSRRARP